MNVTGKGGFSEVWRAYDLIHNRLVAIKMHRPGSDWPPQKKKSYNEHVRQELKIHRKVHDHRNIVRLYDRFDIDEKEDSFATVLEHCDTDLATMLETEYEDGKAPEDEARAVLLQILSGMMHFSDKNFIHYDLKPGNILFVSVESMVKITDFGLSKIILDPENPDGMELTKPGEGTYRYLPPECFDEDPRISGKVDVWSVGIIFYQMLFGRVPTENEQSFEDIIAAIKNQRNVEIPPNPAISKEAKKFIRACLTYDQHKRPDMAELCQHPYLSSP